MPTLSCLYSWSRFINETAKTGLITNATNNDANKVIIKVIGKKYMNLPTMPGQNNNGKNGATFTNVPVSTGQKTSPAASFTASMMVMSLCLLKIRCEFSITTIASSTTIPNANKNANNTITFNENPKPGKNKNANTELNGTESPT